MNDLREFIEELEYNQTINKIKNLENSVNILERLQDIESILVNQFLDIETGLEELKDLISDEEKLDIVSIDVNLQDLINTIRNYIETQLL